MAAICQKFGLPSEQPESVHKADGAMLYAEKDQLMAPMAWDTKWSSEPPADVKVKCWDPERAQVNFLHRFYQLTESE